MLVLRGPDNRFTSALYCELLDSGRPQFGKIRLRKDEIKDLHPNIAKAKKVLNWTPKIGIISGLKKTINYYKKMGKK